MGPDKLDLIFLIKIFIRKKYIIIALVPVFMYIFLVKEGRNKIYFETEGVLYIVNESKVFGLSNVALRKILPEYKGESEKEHLREYIKSPIVLSRTIVKSGYNAYFHEDKENYKPSGVSVYEWLIKIKNIYNLNIHNIYQNYKVINSSILNDKLKKVTLKIIFNNNTVEIFDLFGKKIGFLNLKNESVFENNSVRFEIKKLNNIRKVYDEKIFLTIVNQNYVLDEVVDKITINKKKDTSLAKVSFKGSNPFLIKEFLDILMEEFIQYNIELKVKNINHIAEFLSDELTKLANRRNNYIKKIYEIEKSANLVISNSTNNNLFGHISTYTKEKNNLILNINKLKYIRDKLNKNKISNIYLSEGISVFSTISKISNILLDEIRKFDEIKLEYTKYAPQYKRQLKNIMRTKKMLELEIEYKIKELETRLNRVELLLVKYNRNIFLNSKLSREIDFYLKEIDLIDQIRKDIYIQQKNLMTDKVFIKYGNRKMKDAKLSYAISNPVKNKVISYIFLSVLLSLFVIVVKYLIFPVFYSKMEISNKDKIIGGIPEIPEKMVKNGIINFSKDNKIFELFRLLLSMMVINKRNFKVLLFTSSYHMDGRTFMAMNFAAITAISGKKKVLVITIYPVNTGTNKNIYNFNEVLEYEKKAEKIKVGIDTYFYRFHCISRNSDKNIDISDNDNEVYTIIKELKEKCDFVIFDCLAYPMYADTFLYASSCDIVFSILRLNHTPIKVYGKHLNDLDKYVKDYNIIVNSDRVNLNSSGYILEEKGSIAYYKEKIKYFIARL